MSPRDSLVTAALRWSAARERRLAAGAEKRRADALYKTHNHGSDVMHLAAWRYMHAADATAADSRRQERLALRALAKACAAVRRDMQGAAVFDVAQTVTTLLLEQAAPASAAFSPANQP